MNKTLDRGAHIFLFLGLALGVVAIYGLLFDSIKQFLVVAAMVAFYVLWGLIFHNLKNDLTKKLFWEYLILGAIAIIAGFLVFMA